jgi:hypothetical protein
MNELLRLWVNLAFYFLLFFLIEHTYKYIERNKHISQEKFKQPSLNLVAKNIN